jgi:hypothetical protein
MAAFPPSGKHSGGVKPEIDKSLIKKRVNRNRENYKTKLIFY